MVKMRGTLPLVGLDLRVPQPQGRFFKSEAYIDGHELLYGNGPEYSSQELTFRARIVEIIFALAAALLVFSAATEMFSLQAGLCALLLFCFEPTLVAHSSYVTTDMAASFGFLATIYAFWRWTVKPTLPPLPAVGVPPGLALPATHSPAFSPPMFLLPLDAPAIPTY